MTSLHQNLIEKLTGANRKCWRLQEILPTEEEKEKPQFTSYFQLHKKTWRCVAVLYDNFFAVSVFFKNRGTGRQFNVQMGIFGESGENIVMSNVKQVTNSLFKVYISKPSSELLSLVQSNQLFIFYVEIEKKDESKEKAKVCK